MHEKSFEALHEIRKSPQHVKMVLDSKGESSKETPEGQGNHEAIGKFPLTCFKCGEVGHYASKFLEKTKKQHQKKRNMLFQPNP